jgi:CBS domain-containing protein
MTDRPRTLRSTDVVGNVRDLMLTTDVHGVPVLDLGRTLVGIVTSTDLIEEWPPDTPITEVMSDAVEVVAPGMSLVDAGRRMRSNRIHHLVVMDGEDVVGVVSSFDLLEGLADEVELRGSNLPAGTDG